MCGMGLQRGQSILDAKFHTLHIIHTLDKINAGELQE